MSGQSLKEKTAKGLMWGGFSNGIQQLLNLLFGIFLARLLTPDDYGMVGVLAIFTMIASTLQESGFTVALANKQEIRHEDYNAVFWFSTLTGLFLYILLFFCAPLIAAFFHEPALVPLARYCFLGFLITSTGIAHNAYLFRNLMVKQNALINVSSLFVSGVTGVIMAYYGMAYWGMATQSIVYVTGITLQRWMYSSWCPTLHIDLRPLRPMVSFSVKLLATNIFQHINYNLLTVVMGHFYHSREVGYFNQANKWNYMGSNVIQGMVQGVAQPVLRNVADDHERQLRVFRKMLRFTAFVSFPTLFGLSLVAPELITIAITDKWMQSVGIMQILCIGSAFVPLQNLYSNLIISQGKSGRYMKGIVALGVVQAITALCLCRQGIHAMVICYAGINVLWTLVWHYLAWKEIRLSLRDALMDTLPFLLVAAGSMTLTGYLTTRTIHQIHLLFFCKVMLAATLYLAVLWMCKAKVLKESIDYLIHKKR